MKVEIKELKLPNSFSLKENEDFLFLKADGKIIATFCSISVKPREIEKEIKKYLRVKKALKTKNAYQF